MFSKLVLIGLGPAEILVIVVVAFVLLVILGPKNLPKLGNSIGKGIKGLRKGMSDDDKKDDEDKDEVVVEAEEVKTEPKKATTKTAKKSTTTAKSGTKTTKKKVVKKKSE